MPWWRPGAAARPARIDRERIDRNLALMQRVAAAGALLGAVSNVVTGGDVGAVVLVASAGFSGLSMWMLGRGWRRSSAAVLLAAFLTLIHTLATVGDGIRDVAIALYPVLVVSAALLLDPVLLVGATVASVASVAGLAFVETPEISEPIRVRSFVDLSIIIVVTAISVYRLVADVAGWATEAQAQKRRLAVAYRALEGFTDVVSHDLKSPLVTIRGFLDYVERDIAAGDPSRIEDDMGRIRAATDRMGSLLDDLLELSRTGRIDRPRAEIRFGDVVDDARALAAGRLEARGVRVEVQEAASVQRVVGDRARLGQLLQNLLDNAARFSGEGPDPRVEIGVRPGAGPDGPPTFFVRDNGIGIPAEHHERVFELFHRLDLTREGTGFGLTLARRIVETHGGRMWVESEGPGRGSTFLFTLPGSPDSEGAPQEATP